MAERFGESPYTGKFLVEVDGVRIGTFSKVTGLTVEVELETVEEGGQNQYAHQLPRGLRWPNVVFTRGVTESDNFLAWVSRSSGDGLAATGGKLERTTAAITMLGRAGERVRSWELDGAFPVRWNGPTFASTAAETASEELEITHNGFRSPDAG